MVDIIYFYFSWYVYTVVFHWYEIWYCCIKNETPNLDLHNHF